MSFLNEASKLLTNKYFLYFIVFLSATNVLGYLVTNNINAVIFFLLVCLITYQFSKNMTVILLIAVISTNFLIANKKLREGLENEKPKDKSKDKVKDKSKESQDTKENPSLSTIGNKDEQIAKAIELVKKSSDNNNEVIKDQLKKLNIPNNQEGPPKITDTNNLDLNESKDEAGPEGFGEKIGNKKGSKQSEHFGPRLDYAATIEQSYQNLDNILGSDSIKQLTNDTQKLMAQQQNLFNTMNQMVPVLQSAQDMLKGFNINDLTKSLGSINNLSNAPIPKSSPA